MASGSIAAFTPEATIGLTAGTTSTAVSLPGSGPTLLVFNATSSIAFLKLGASPQTTARATDLPIPAGSQILLGISATVTAVAAILTTGSGTIYITQGSGSAF